MRQFAIALIVIAALSFIVGIYASLAGALVFGKPGMTLWRGAIAVLLFAIAILQLRLASKP
jgi:hypothetical protein